MVNAIRIEGMKYGIKFLPEQMICDKGEYNGKECAVVWWEGPAKIYKIRGDKHTIKIETSPVSLDQNVPEYATTPQGGIIYFAKKVADGRIEIVERPSDANYDAKIDAVLEAIYTKTLEVDVDTCHEEIPVITPGPIFVELEKELVAENSENL